MVSVHNTSSLDLTLTPSEPKIKNLACTADRKLLSGERTKLKKKSVENPLVLSKSVEMIIPALKRPRKMTQYFTPVARIATQKRLKMW